MTNLTPVLTPTGEAAPSPSAVGWGTPLKGDSFVMATDTKPDAQRPDAESSIEAVAMASEEKPVTMGITSNRIVRAVALVLVLALAAGGAWMFLSGGGSDKTGESATTTFATKNGQTTLTDTKAGFTITYPAEWAEVPIPKSADTPALIISQHLLRISGTNVLKLQSSTMETPVDEGNLANMRATIEAGLSNPVANLVVVDVQETKVANLLAVRYIYKYTDENGPGVHAHFFIFDGKVMHTVMFQVAPVEDYAKYTELFDQVIASFKPLDE